MNLILASASPRRKELVRKLENVHVKIIPSGEEENIDPSSRTPDEYAVALACLKAKSVFAEHGGVVLGADTIVVLDGEILGKPKTIAEADEMLKKLCGKTHEVITGICIMSDEKTITDSEISRVTFAQYNAPIIEAYIMSGAPFDKAGGYGVQDIALTHMITKVEGDIDNVIGLPVKKVGELLKQFGDKDGTHCN